jgi:hypothetical protein
VPEKRFWHIKVKALAASGQWEALRQFAAEKKSPVGYKPFAQACIAHRQPATSTKGYIDRITQLEDKCVPLAATSYTHARPSRCGVWLTLILYCAWRVGAGMTCMWR